jgi:hypothetical protein
MPATTEAPTCPEPGHERYHTTRLEAYCNSVAVWASITSWEYPEEYESSENDSENEQAAENENEDGGIRHCIYLLTAKECEKRQ